MTGEADDEFSSGEAVAGEDIEYSRPVDDAGFALYHCEPHLSIGMTGSIVVD